MRVECPFCGPRELHEYHFLRVLAPPDADAVNVLRIADTVLVAAGFPQTAERIAGLGLRVRTLDNSELRKAEGALTCCSLLFEA